MGAILLTLAETIFAAEFRPRTLLLVDDHHVLYRSGTERIFHPATRHSDHPVIQQDKIWEVAIAYTSVHRDAKTGKYQMWYQAYAGHRAGDKHLECVVCYAESDDGIKFVKPELELFSFKEFKKSNIVLVGNGGYGDRYCNSVVVQPDDPDPARRYKMAYYDWSVVDGREYPGLHVAFSPDGIHWTKHPVGPLDRTAYGARSAQPPFADEDPYQETSGKNNTVRKSWHYGLTMSDAVDVFWDPVRRVYARYGKMWLDAPDGTAAWKHAMGRTESADFIHWSKPELLLTADDQDGPEVEFHTSPVFYHQGCYFCLNQIFNRRAKGAIDIELMLSRDGLSWQRPFRGQYFLARSKPGLFDSRSIFTSSDVVVLDDELRFYYGAYNQSPIGGVRSAPGERSGVGLVTLPRDRFAGIRPLATNSQPTLKKPLAQVGQITLKAMELTGCKEISINASAPEGSIRAELLTADGLRVRGFSADDAVPITGDSLRHKVAWKGRSQLPTGAYLLRLHLKQAEVFAVTLQ